MTARDYFLSIFSGVLLILIFPQWNIPALAWLCLIPLLFALKDKEPYQGFLLGAITGFILNLGLVYWVTVSMTTYGKMPAILSLGVLVLFSLYLCLFIAVPAWCSCYVQQHKGLAITITLPFFWVTSEYIKSWFLTGFPWENLGYSQYQVLPVIQIADITGVYGISFLIVVINCGMFLLCESVSQKKRLPYQYLIIAMLLLSVTLVYGGKRLAVCTGYENPGNVITVALIQGNIAQDVKWDPTFLNTTMQIYSRLTLEAAREKPDIVIWPEAATPFYFQSEIKYQQMVASLMNQANAYLLLGSPAWEKTDKEAKFFNSAFLLSPDGSIQGRYDKIHLVPYGEYVPLKPLFPFIEKMAVGIGDFSSGENVTLLKFPQGIFGTLICYEIIFPDLVRRFAKKGAGFLVNITNDAWFGRTSAPYQHLSMAVLRAVENRRFVARAANTGVTAIIDTGGRIVKQTGLFTQAHLTGMISPTAERTFYTRCGDVFAKLCSVIALFLIVLVRFRVREDKKAFL